MMSVGRLTSAQEGALLGVEARLAEWGEHRAEQPIDDLKNDIGGSNVFAIDGPRGSGKTTVLFELCDKGPDLREKGLLICQPLDCSLMLPEVAPGAVLLMHLGAQLVGNLAREAKERVAKELKVLQALQETSFQAAEVYQTLVVELSSSIGDYGHQVSTALLRRFELRDELGSCLNSMCQALKIRALVVPLDDFDLAPGGIVRKMMRSLLDELRQSRLLFVLTADLSRVEHLSWDAKAEVDDKTGRALLEKLVPTQNCERLREWNLEDRERFTGSSDVGPTLLDMVSTFAGGDPLQKALLKMLLPIWPRGLVNLHESLRKGYEAKSFDPLSEEKLSSFLGVLASCRGEPLLARKLREQPISRVVESFDLRGAEASLEQWRESVEASRVGFQSVGDEERLPFIAGLALRPRVALVHGSGKEKLPASEEASLTYDLWGRAPASRDPLRHDLQQVQSLRDSEEAAVPYWVELLGNWGFSKKVDAPSTMAPIRHRLQFLERWSATAKRAQTARFQVALTTRYLRDLFLDRETVPRGCLLWMSWSVTGSEATAEIGWWTLLENLRGVRDPLHSERLDQLAINVTRVVGAPPRIGSPEELEVLPDRLRALILLIDSLDRCPWIAGGSTGWAVDSYLGLAAVLVRTAYVHSRVQARLLPFESLSEAQQWFVSLLEDRDALRLLKVPEEDLRPRLIELLEDPWLKELDGKTDSLAAAARCFRDSMAYQSVKELFGLPSSTRQPSA